MKRVDFNLLRLSYIRIFRGKLNYALLEGGGRRSCGGSREVNNGHVNRERLAKVRRHGFSFSMYGLLFNMLANIVLKNIWALIFARDPLPRR